MSASQRTQSFFPLGQVHNNRSPDHELAYANQHGISKSELPAWSGTGRPQSNCSGRKGPDKRPTSFWFQDQFRTVLWS